MQHLNLTTTLEHDLHQLVLDKDALVTDLILNGRKFYFIENRRSTATWSWDGLRSKVLGILQKHPNVKIDVEQAPLQFVLHV